MKPETTKRLLLALYPYLRHFYWFRLIMFNAGVEAPWVTEARQILKDNVVAFERVYAAAPQAESEAMRQGRLIHNEAMKHYGN